VTKRGEPMAYYLAHVDDETEECIVWPYSASRGYGWLLFDGHVRPVHVLACERRHGLRPAGMEAIHAPVVCHNTRCFNWRHLRWGTHSENIRDAIRDGTAVNNLVQRPGEEHGTAKLTWTQVNEIRARYATGEVGYTALAREYGVHNSTIGGIITQKYWRT
jgi:HNH endonuclease